MSVKSSRIDDPYFIKELFTRINLKPHQFKELEQNININLKNKVEGRNQTCGYVNPNSSIIIKRSVGHQRGSHLTGEMTYDINYIAEVCYPMKDDVVVANVNNINEAGLIAINGPLILFAPKEYKQNYSFFEQGINLGSKVKFQVVDSKSQLYDNTIDVVVTILEILDNNIYYENDNNRTRINNMEIMPDNIELKQTSNFNENLFGYDDDLKVITKNYEKIPDDKQINIVKAYVNKYELINPNNDYHVPLSLKFMSVYNNDYFELIELNEYYDLICENKNKEKYLFFNDNSLSMVKANMYLRNSDGNESYNDNLVVISGTKIAKNDNANIIKANYGSTTSFTKLKSKLFNGIYVNNHGGNDKDMLMALKYCFSNLNLNGFLVIKTKFIYNSFTYKIVSYLSHYFEECHYARPESCKDYEDTCYLVFKYYKKLDNKGLDTLLTETNYNDMKNINIDKHDLKNIMIFNNKNGKQIYYKSLTKTINYISDLPSDNDVQQKLIAQKSDAQRWLSKFIK